MLDKVDEWAGKRSEEKTAELKISCEVRQGYHYIDKDYFTLDVDKETQELMTLLVPLFKAQMKREKVKIKEELPTPIKWSVTDERG